MGGLVFANPPPGKVCIKVDCQRSISRGPPSPLHSGASKRVYKVNSEQVGCPACEVK